MSIRVDTASWIPGAIVVGNRGLGVLAEDIPSEGDNGASFLYNDISLPSDSGKEICGRVTTWPSAGALYAYEDGSFEFSGAPDGNFAFQYQLYVDGAASGTGTVSLQVGDSTIDFSVTTDAAAFSGSAGSGAEARISVVASDAVFSGSALSLPQSGALIAAATDGAVFAGNAAVSPVTKIVALTDSAAFSGGAVVATGVVWPSASDVRLGVTYGPTGAEYVGTMTGGSVDYDAIAAAVLAALQGTTIPVNIKQVNDVTVQGAGTKLNPWQPV